MLEALLTILVLLLAMTILVYVMQSNTDDSYTIKELKHEIQCKDREIYLLKKKLVTTTNVYY